MVLIVKRIELHGLTGLWILAEPNTINGATPGEGVYGTD